MTRLTPYVAGAVVAALAILSLSSAHAKQDNADRSDWFEPYEITYLDAYEKAHEAGFDVGANLVDDGIGGRERVEESTARLERWLDPPEPATVPVESEGVAPAPASSTVATSSGGCPSYMAAEASSPSDVNPTSGAAGCWQVIPSTAAAMGAACADVNSYACLNAICAAQGNSAWAASGATPC